MNELSGGWHGMAWQMRRVSFARMLCCSVSRPADLVRWMDEPGNPILWIGRRLGSQIYEWLVGLLSQKCEWLEASNNGSSSHIAEINQLPLAK
jgi:hypothetical protein